MSHDRDEPKDAPGGGGAGGSADGDSTLGPTPGPAADPWADAEPDQTQPVPPGEGPPDAPDRTRPFDPRTGPDQTRRQTAGGAGAWSGRAGVPPPRPAAGDAEPAAWSGYDSSGGRPWWLPILLGILALLLLGVLGVGFWLLSESDDRDGPVTPSPSATSREPSRTPTPTATTGRPTPSRTSAAPVPMPPLVGLPLDSAQELLDELGLKSRVEFAPSGQPAGTVIDTDPGAGVLVEAGQPVTLVVAQPRRTQPGTVEPSAPGSTSPGP